MLIDCNCWLGFWPFNLTSVRSPAVLARHLSAQGVQRALVSNVESILGPDPHLPSRRLLAQVRPHRSLIPVPVLDPSLGNWRDCLDAYREAGFGSAVRIVPNYHRYELSSPCVVPLVEELAGDPRATLLIQMRVEDERQQFPLMKVPGVPVDAVVALAKSRPAGRILCLCAYLAEAVRLTTEAANVWVDLAFIEYLDTVKHALARVPPERLVFGSHTPFLYTRANVMKLSCAEIPDSTRTAIASGNAGQILHALKGEEV